MCSRWLLSAFFFFNDTATTEIYTLSLHDALPICPRGESPAIGGVGLDSFGPNPTANSVGAEEGGSSSARTTIQLGTDGVRHGDRKSTRLNSSHANISYAVFCLKKKKRTQTLIILM